MSHHVLHSGSSARGEGIPKMQSTTGGELLIVANSDESWKVRRYLHEWCDLSKGFHVATGYFDIGGLPTPDNP